MPPEDSLRPQVSVIGSSKPDDESYDQALKVGQLLGEQDVTLICGGRFGVMEAVCKGIQKCPGGRAVGILPSEDRSTANSYLDVVVSSGVGEARNLAVILSGDSVISVSGGYGTLTEVAYALKFDKPVFGINSWDHSDLSYPHNLSPEEAVRRALEVIN